MNWLVDTDVLSERAKSRPDPKVLAWLESNADAIYTSSHVIGELQTGIALLPEGSRKRALQAWLNRPVIALAESRATVGAHGEESGTFPEGGRCGTRV